MRAAVERLRAAGVTNLYLDLIFGVPGQGGAELDRDLADALALAPEHVSYYELEAKPGTRFTHRHGAELARQAELLEGYYEQVIATLGTAGYRWYETANFCRDDRRAAAQPRLLDGPRLPRHRRRRRLDARARAARERPALAAFLRALERGRAAAAPLEQLTPQERARERLMLGLRLDVPLALRGLEQAIDPEGLARMDSLGLIEPAPGTLRLTRRGRMLANDVTASLIA